MTMHDALQKKPCKARAGQPADATAAPRAKPNDVDAQWIREALSGDGQAFARLVNRHQQRLFNSMVYLVGNRAEAEDVVQDTLLCCYRKLHTFQGRSDFYVWLYAIALNVARTAKRRRKAEVSLDDLRHPRVFEPVAREPIDAAERSEQRDLVRAALQAVSPRHRAILVLRDVEGFSYDRISQTMGLPVGTVRSRLHRARLALRHCYHRLR